MFKRLLVLVSALVTLAAIAAPGASGSRNLMVGIYDDTMVLFGNPDRTFPMLRSLGTQALRVNLYWGGAYGVAPRRPARPRDPLDPAYRWDMYDRAVHYAAQYGIKIVFSIYGTPSWANGHKTPNIPPTRMTDLQNFAYAAATRYGGVTPGEDGRILPNVRHWLAWNEPNNPTFLKNQYKRVGGKWIIQSARDYAKICNAVYRGIRATLIRAEKIACGVTGPRGNNNPNSPRPSVSPLAFLRAMKAAGARSFDAYAHHPYYGRPTESPSTRPPPGKKGNITAVTLGNLDVLVTELGRLYGRKRIWITEYAYQTNPPDRVFGVSYAAQARYLTEAFQIALKHPRIDMMLWFLLRDEARYGIWQSGLLTYGMKRKPAYAAFQRFTRLNGVSKK